MGPVSTCSTEVGDDLGSSISISGAMRVGLSGGVLTWGGAASDGGSSKSNSKFRFESETPLVRARRRRKVSTRWSSSAFQSGGVPTGSGAGSGSLNPALTSGTVWMGDSTKGRACAAAGSSGGDGSASEAMISASGASSTEEVLRNPLSSSSSSPIPKGWPHFLQRSVSRKLSNPQLGHFTGGL